MIRETHNPDVLNCLANLSSDEVFTSPRIVNEMLDMLPQDLFENKNAKFLEPCCKSGVFLREIAKRLLVGLENEIPNLQERINHIFKNQLYGISITRLTSLLTRRSLYCSKTANGKYSIGENFDNEDGNIKFNNIKHTFKDHKCVYCGVSDNVDTYTRDDTMETHAYEFIHTNNPEELFNMKFDVIIGNPPYQLNDGGGTGSSAMPLYHKFVNQAMNLSPRYLSMIIPSRWYAGGKGLDDFRDKMLNNKHISNIVDYANSADCFPGVTIAGGVCYFLWKRDEECICKVVNKQLDNIISEEIRRLDEFPIFVRDNKAINIIRKIKLLNEKTMDELVYSRNCFGLFSNEVGHPGKGPTDLILYSLKGKSYIEEEYVKDRDGIVNKYKVIMTKAMSGGNKPSSDGNYLVISETMKVLSPGEVCTETYLCLGDFDLEDKAINLKNYLKTKFFRYLLLQALTSINISKDKFCFIPIQDFNINWTDDMLYKKYNLEQEEIEYIESMIKPME